MLRSFDGVSLFGRIAHDVVLECVRCFGSTYSAVVDGSETIIAASQGRRVMVCPVDEINFLSGPGKGVLLIKLDKSDRLLAAITAVDDRDTLTVKTSMGGEQRLNTGRYKVTGRGGKGHEFVSRGQIVEVIHQPVAAPAPLEP